MVPETVPAYLPPRSIVAPQAHGITRSLQKLAMAMVSIARTGLLTPVDNTKHPHAPANPEQATIRRVLATSRVQRVRRSATNTLTGLASPPTNKGRTLSSVVEVMVRWRPSLRYVGSQVM